MQWQESLASAACPLSLRRRPRADLWRGEGLGGHGRNDNEEILGTSVAPCAATSARCSRGTGPACWHLSPGSDVQGGEERENRTGQQRVGGQAGGCGLRRREGDETDKSLLFWNKFLLYVCREKSLHMCFS